jgi:hypothetical protein
MFSEKIYGEQGMGGWGSGYFRPHKTTVEACLTLDIAQCTRSKVLQPGVHLEGQGCMPHPETGELVSEIHCVLDTTVPEAAALRLRYWHHEPDDTPAEQFEYAIALTTTLQHYGGVRWWFHCPLGVDGQACSRRVRKLYLPPGARYFGCRHCYDLTYASRQTSQKTPRWLGALLG